MERSHLITGGILDPQLYSGTPELADDRYGLWCKGQCYHLRIVETAKANNLNPYYYFDHLLTEIPKLKEYNAPEEEAAAMERLLTWSTDLPDNCHKRSR